MFENKSLESMGVWGDIYLHLFSMKKSTIHVGEYTVPPMDL